MKECAPLRTLQVVFHFVCARVCVRLLNPAPWISDVGGTHPLPLIRAHAPPPSQLPTPRAQFQIALMESVLHDCNASETHSPRSSELSAWQGCREVSARKWVEEDEEEGGGGGESRLKREG